MEYDFTSTRTPKILKEWVANVEDITVLRHSLWVWKNGTVNYLEKNLAVSYQVICTANKEIVWKVEYYS